MQIISAHSPQRTASGGIELMVTFAGIGEVPFHATMHDTEPHGRELYTRAMLGEFGNVAPYQAPVIPIHDLAAAKLAAINEGKNVALDAGFWHDGTLYDSDYKARLAYLEAATQFQIDPGFSTPWKASTGHWVTMDAALFASLIPVYRAHVQACFAWQGAREQEVAAALALEDEGEIRAALAAISEVFS